MGKNIYIGVSGVARKVKTPNIGVGGVARNVKTGYIGVNGVARKFYPGIKSGHYWVIEEKSMREFNSSGTLVNSTSGTTISSWTCPESGTYEVEMHAVGGRGGDGVGNYGTRGSTNRRYSAAGAGGGGGGSGAEATLNLSAGTYTVNLSDNSKVQMSGNGYTADQLYVTSGWRGGNGTAQWVSAAATGGAGGTHGECGTLMTNIAENGNKGGAQGSQVSWTAAADGGLGGSGGASISDYGTGGKGGDAAAMGSDNGGYGAQTPVIIIRKL